MKAKYLSAYMEMAEVFSKTSEANRLKVAALIIKNDAIISLGINGTPYGWSTNSCEDETGNTAWFVTHAEDRALSKLINSNETAKGSVMIVTHAPCKMCSLRIKDAGISEVIYKNEYRDSSGIEYLKQAGIIVRKYNE